MHDGSARDLAQIACADSDHGEPQFVVEQLEHTLDSRLTISAKSPDIGSADPHCRRTQCQRFKYIRAAADAAIHNDRDSTSHLGHDLRQALQCAPTGVCRPAAVIGHNDSFMWVTSLRRLMKSHVSDAELMVKPVVSSCENMGRVKTIDPPGAWHAVQVLVSVRAHRMAVSIFLPAGKSTVTATAGQPAASARLTSLAAMSKLDVV
jgi:hypothetical protein